MAVKAILMSSQVEMGMEREIKASLVTKRNELICVCILNLWDLEFETNEQGYLVGETNEQSEQGAAWLLLTAYHNRQEERKK
jgi:hypothetical protein